MIDPTAQEAPTTEAPAEPTQTQTEETTKPSGSIEDNWREIHGKDSTLKPFVDSSKTYEEYVGKLANGYTNQSKMMGKKEVNESGEEKETTQATVPETAGDYELGEGAEWFGDVALENGLTQEQVSGVEKAFNSRIEGIVEQQNKEFDDTLKAEWGDEYESNIESAKSFLADNLGDEDIQKLSGVDNNGLLILSKVALSLQGKYHTNSSVPSGDGVGSSVEALEAQLNELTSSDIYRNPGMHNHAQHQKAVKDAVAIQQKINKLK